MDDATPLPTATYADVRELFLGLQTPAELAALLQTDYQALRNLLYYTPHARLYRSFGVPKRSGGVREILAPTQHLKDLQTRLNSILQCVYLPQHKLSVHGFLPGRSILTGAKFHTKQRYVLNIDLQDFFPSINFGRVRGLFMGTPYHLDARVATVLAQICCFANQLPQGAPTSPVISNMICARMDSHLQRLAASQRCFYTRYADDLSFSTYTGTFPLALAVIGPDNRVEIGGQLAEVVAKNGFRINPAKTRLQRCTHRQEVVGLIVNDFPNVERRYVRHIRSMLYAWEKHGYEAAQAEFVRQYDHAPRHRVNKRLFAQVIQGRIAFLGMIRSKHNPAYLRFIARLRLLAPEMVPADAALTPSLPGTSQVVLNAGQLQRFQQVLLAAFPHQADLAQMVRFGLDKNLEEITGGERLTDRVFSLLEWAGAHDKYGALLSAAYRANPDNLALRALTVDFGITDV